MRTLKKATIEATKSRILRAKELTVKGIEAEPKILVKEDIYVDFIIKQII